MKDKKPDARPIRVTLEAKELCTIIAMINNIPTGMGEKKVFGARDCDSLQIKAELTKAYVVRTLDRALGIKSGIHVTLVPYSIDIDALTEHLRRIR